MRSIAMLAAALVIAAGMYGGARAQDQSQQQGPSSDSMMGGGMMGGQGGMGPGMMGYGGMGPRMMGQAMCTKVSDIDGRLAYLKAEIKITEAQEPLWDAYSATAHDNAKAILARCTAVSQQGSSTLSLPDRLDQYELLMSARLDALRATIKTVKPLYAALTDSQKQTVDRLFWGPMGMI